MTPRMYWTIWILVGLVFPWYYHAAGVAVHVAARRLGWLP